MGFTAAWAKEVTRIRQGYGAPIDDATAKSITAYLQQQDSIRRTEMNTIKLVLHVDQADRWPAALNNLTNLTRDYPDAEIRVVANGAGVYAFLGSTDLTTRLAEASGKQVAFQVCANALREHAIDPAHLPGWATVVPAGVVALAEAQNEGFAYVKP